MLLQCQMCWLFLHHFLTASSVLLDKYCGQQRLHQSPTALQLPQRRTDNSNNLLTMQESTGKFLASTLVGVTLTCTTQLNIIADQGCPLKGTWQRDFMSLAPWIIWIPEPCGVRVNSFSFFIVFFTRLHAPALYFSAARVSAIFEHDKVHKPYPPKSPGPSPIQHSDRRMDNNETPQDPKDPVRAE